MDALVLSPNRWDGILDVGIFKLARFLQKMGYEVEHANLEFPKFHMSRKRGVTYTMIRPLPTRFMKWRWLWNLTYHFQAYSGLRREWDLLLTDSSPLLYFANRVKARLKIYRLNDYLEGFKVPEVILDEEKKFISESDVILVAHKNLMDRAPSDKAVYLPNPIDLSLFPAEGNFSEPEDIRNVKRPRVVYVGAVAEWFDWETLIRVAKRLSDVSFVVVGPVRFSFPQLPKNIHTLGPKPHTDVHLYLRHSDVAIIPFKLSPLIESMDFPNKVLEYLALGLPTVSVYWESFAKNFPNVLFYESIDDAVHAIEKALDKGKDMSLRKLVEPYSTHRIFERFRNVIDSLV